MLDSSTRKANARLFVAAVVAAIVAIIPTLVVTAVASAATYNSTPQKPGSVTIQAAGTSFLLKNYSNGYCLDIADEAVDGPVVQWACNGKPSQYWHVGSSLDGYYQIVNGNGTCLSLNGGNTAAGTEVVGLKCLGTTRTDQYWFAQAEFLHGSIWYTALDNYAGIKKALDNVVTPIGGSSAEGANLVITPYVPANDQFWAVGSTPIT